MSPALHCHPTPFPELPVEKTCWPNPYQHCNIRLIQPVMEDHIQLYLGIKLPGQWVSEIPPKEWAPGAGLPFSHFWVGEAVLTVAIRPQTPVKSIWGDVGSSSSRDDSWDLLIHRIMIRVHLVIRVLYSRDSNVLDMERLGNYYESHLFRSCRRIRIQLPY